MEPKGAIVIFAKCPLPNRSKTRLLGLLGPDGAASFARAMLSDVLLSVSDEPRLNDVRKVLVYAPGDEQGRRHMMQILQGLHLSYHDNVDRQDRNGNVWHLMPMLSSSSLTSSNLGDKLADALDRVRTLCWSGYDHRNDNGNRNQEEERAVATAIADSGPVVFLGMDSPELPMDEIVYALDLARNDITSTTAATITEGNTLNQGGDETTTPTENNHNPTTTKRGLAYLNPAYDGGYGMICIPPHAPPTVFHGIRWSDPLTAMSQLKSLTDHGLEVRIGSLMSDVDESEDVRSLAVRLCRFSSSSISLNDNDVEDDILLQSPSQMKSNKSRRRTRMSSCPQTFQALVDLNLIVQEEGEVRDGANNIDRGNAYCINLKRWSK